MSEILEPVLGRPLWEAGAHGSFLSDHDRIETLCGRRLQVSLYRGDTLDVCDHARHSCLRLIDSGSVYYGDRFGLDDPQGLAVSSLAALLYLPHFVERHPGREELATILHLSGNLQALPDPVRPYGARSAALDALDWWVQRSQPRHYDDEAVRLRGLVRDCVARSDKATGRLGDLDASMVLVAMGQPYDYVNSPYDWPYEHDSPSGCY